MKNNIILKVLFSKPFLAFLGFLSLLYYIWFRFIRSRIPKEIPFNLTLISLLILMYICILYFYIVLRIIKPRTPNTFTLYIKNLFDKLATPYVILDHYLHTNKFAKLILKKNLELIKNILVNLKTIHILEIINNTLNIIINISKIIFIFLFIIDLYNNKLNLIYKFILFQIIPLIFMYYIYLLKLYVQNKIKELSKCYMVEITSSKNTEQNFFVNIKSITFDEDYTNFDGGYVEDPDPLLEIQHFIDLQINNIQFGIYDLYEFKCYVKKNFKEEYAKKYKLKNINEIDDFYLKNKHILEQEFNYWIPILTYNSVWIDIYTCSIYSEVRQRLTLKIYIIYFLIWLYILVVSINTFHFSNIEIILLKTWQDIYEPFSNLPL